MYIVNSGGKDLIASAYPCCYYVFNEWVPDEMNNSNVNGEWVITKNTKFNAQLSENPFTDNKAVITGTVYSGSEESGVFPLVNYKAYFRTYSGGIYKTYTDVNEHFRIAGIPFNSPGAFNGYMEGYVSDYSDVITFGITGSLEPGIDLGTTLISKSIYIDFLSNNADQIFNISKWYISVFRPPETSQLAEEIVVPAYEGHQFPEGAYFRVLKEDETIDIYKGGTRTFKAGTLVYFYIFRWGIVGGIRY